MTDAEADRAWAETLVRVGRLAQRVDDLRDRARMLRIMVHVERDIFDAETEAIEAALRRAGR